ncbi:MAG: nickel-dependent lactate racemase [Chloroflexi bacterium]|nr:nickel-dependent lactate racemase [Chloroflexota bacterium]MBT4072231.1 nickel-dependent lactate racemase [Chloroflexota bacterium]MBT4515895.1 nickel-dependent lactate racemase [Chloroflexota bacterium]
MVTESTRQVILPYGNTFAEADIPDGRELGTLEVRDVPAIPNLPGAMKSAIENPIGLEQNIFKIAQPGETVAIIVSDATRKTHVDDILPCLLDGLTGSGVRDEDVSFVFATGTHRAVTDDEQAAVLGRDVYERFKAQLFNHDAHDPSSHTYIGTTSRGTRVEINSKVHEADRIIATGAAVLHYFGGYGGGRKSVVPGVASVDTIANNHAMNLDPDSDRINPAVRIGGLDGNPVAEDLLEATKLTHVDYVINTVMNRNGEIAGIFAGDLDAAFEAARLFAHELFAVDILEQADVVIAASASTQNFVQTHKALFNSYQAVKPDGRIVLITPCAEGLGGEQFAKWLRLGNTSAIIAGLREQSEINGQTALSTVQKAPITLMVTDLVEDDVAMLGARKVSTLQGAIDTAFDEVGHDGAGTPTYYVMPSAAYTVPFLPD